MSPLGTINLGPTCITDWFVWDIPASGEVEEERTYLFLVSNPTVFANVNISPATETPGNRTATVNIRVPTDVVTESPDRLVPAASIKRRSLNEGLFIYDLTSNFPEPTLVNYIPTLPPMLQRPLFRERLPMHDKFGPGALTCSPIFVPC